jgi:hypothetical protein
VAGAECSRPLFCSPMAFSSFRCMLINKGAATPSEGLERVGAIHAKRHYQRVIWNNSKLLGRRTNCLTWLLGSAI